MKEGYILGMIRMRFRSLAIARPGPLNFSARLNQTRWYLQAFQQNYRKPSLTLRVLSAARVPRHKTALLLGHCCGPSGIAASMAVPLERRRLNVNCASIAHPL